MSDAPVTLSFNVGGVTVSLTDAGRISLVVSDSLTTLTANDADALGDALYQAASFKRPRGKPGQ